MLACVCDCVTTLQLKSMKYRDRETRISSQFCSFIVFVRWIRPEIELLNSHTATSTHNNQLWLKRAHFFSLSPKVDQLFDATHHLVTQRHSVYSPFWFCVSRLISFLHSFIHFVSFECSLFNNYFTRWSNERLLARLKVRSVHWFDWDNQQKCLWADWLTDWLERE